MLNQIKPSCKYKIDYLEINQAGGNGFEKIKMMSWNILADAPIWKDKYDDMEKEDFIYWDYRKTLILENISNSNPDICLLCEVEHDKIIFFAEFSNANKYGYIYTSCEPPRSKESQKNYLDYTSAKNPGILILFKFDKLKLVNNLAPDYSNYFTNQQKEHKWSEEELKLHLQPCASNIVLFEKLSDNQRFYFVGLHHYHNPKEEDVKEFQITYLLGKLAYKNQIYDYPVIMCGDFNSVPTSKVYGLIEKNGFQSTYKLFTGKEVKLTISVPHFKDTIDYIFVNNKCKVISVKLINEDELKEHEIPNESYPSDHMYLVAELELLNSID